MTGFIDLHSHWIPGVDDGASTIEESISLLRGLFELGFGTVVATPHMRPGLFDNTREDLLLAYDEALPQVRSAFPDLELSLSSEHFFDDIVFERIMNDQALPYDGKRAVLIEFAETHLPTMLSERLFDLRCKGLRPVIAHPERYRTVWKRFDIMEDWVDHGIVLLMDVGALAGKYGRGAKKTAEKMLDSGLCYAVCSDAHSTADIPGIAQGITRLKRLVGKDESTFLLSEGPRRILEGNVDL